MGRQAGYLALSAFAFSWMGLFVKLAGARLPSQEIVMVRAGVALLLCVAGLRRLGLPFWGRDKVGLLLRGLFGFGALSCFFYAVVHLPLAEATVIQYMSPIFTAVLAAVFLRERVSGWIVVALGAGFAGVLLIARPAALFGDSAQPFPPHVVAVAFTGAFLTGCAYVLVRRLGASEHELVIILYFTLVAVPASIPGVVAAGALWPTPREWLLLLLVGICAQLAQIYLTRGLARMPAGPATVILYLQILFATLWGILFLGERPDLWTAAGALLILAGTVIAAKARSRPRPGRRGEGVAVESPE